MLKRSLEDKIFFLTGVGDAHGFAWSIAKRLYQEGAEIILGVWPPILKSFEQALKLGKFDKDLLLEEGSKMEFKAILPLDASFDTEEDIPEEIKSHKRYKDLEKYTLVDAAARLETILEGRYLAGVLHAIGNSPEPTLSLLETSRKGYLQTLSASTYSFVSIAKHFRHLVENKGAFLTLSFLASERTVPGYGGGLNAAKAALESDTRYLAWELGREKEIRVNAISAGPLASRAAKALGFIGTVIEYVKQNSPLERELAASDVADAAFFLLSDLSRAVTGTVLYVDNGYHSMGVAPFSGLKQCASPL